MIVLKSERCLKSHLIIYYWSRVETNYQYYLISKQSFLNYIHTSYKITQIVLDADTYHIKGDLSCQWRKEVIHSFGIQPPLYTNNTCCTTTHNDSMYNTMGIWHIWRLSNRYLNTTRQECIVISLTYVPETYKRDKNILLIPTCDLRKARTPFGESFLLIPTRTEVSLPKVAPPDTLSNFTSNVWK